MPFPLLCLDRVTSVFFNTFWKIMTQDSFMSFHFMSHRLFCDHMTSLLIRFERCLSLFKVWMKKELARLELFTHHTHSVFWKIMGFVVREGVRNIERMELCVARGPKTKAFMKRDIIVALALCNTIWKEETEGRKGSEESEKKRKSWSLTHAQTCFHSLFIMLFVKQTASKKKKRGRKRDFSDKRQRWGR